MFHPEPVSFEPVTAFFPGGHGDIDARRNLRQALYNLRHAIDRGASRLCICDTVGHATPDGVRNLIQFTKNVIAGTGREDVGIDWHGHNDRGLGVVNSIFAIEYGADRIHGTALGIGERVGNAALDQILLNLKLLGELEDLAHARGAAELSQLALSAGDVKVEAAGPARIRLGGGRVELEPVSLRGQGTELTLAGTAAPGGALDLNASGGVDLRLVGALVPTLRRTHGQLSLAAHLGGTVDEPLLVGSGRLSDAGFQLRGGSATLSSLEGALSFSQSRVIFDGLSALVNGGRAQFKGEVELARLAPARLRVEAALDEVPVAVPAYLPATLTGRVEAVGTPDATTVTGRLHVVRARYTADVNLEGSLLELRRNREHIAALV